jgi:hypothetical protein
MWDGLPPSVGAIAQLNGISQNVNLYNITADYKYRSSSATRSAITDRRRWVVLQARLDFEEHVYTDNNGVSADLVLVWIHLQRRIR